MWLSARWGGAFTPPLVTACSPSCPGDRHSWFSARSGVVWAVFFYRWYRDNPRDNPSVNAAELALLQRRRAPGGRTRRTSPGRKFVASNRSGCFAAQYFCLSYPLVFLHHLAAHVSAQCAPCRYRQQRHSGRSAAVSGRHRLPGRRLHRHAASPRATGSTATTRRLLAYIGFTGACTLLFVAPQFENALSTMLAMGFASFCNDLVMPGAWGACMDVGGKYAGTLSGTMNMMGNIGGALSPS